MRARKTKTTTGKCRAGSLAVLGWTALAAFVLCATAAAGELTLGGLRPGHDRLERAIKLYGKSHLPVDPNTPELLTWADPGNSQFLRLELNEEKIIQSVTLSSYGPGAARTASLPAKTLATGKGLRLGDPVEKAVKIYGKPYFEGPSSDGNRKLLLLVHKFEVPEDEPQIMETSYDPQTRKLVKIVLAFAYY